MTIELIAIMSVTSTVWTSPDKVLQVYLLVERLNSILICGTGTGNTLSPNVSS